MRKLMSMLLALCLVLAMVPVAASAEGTDNITVTGLSGSTTESFGTLAEALQAVNSDSGSETITISIPAGTYTASANDQFKITRNNVTVTGAGQDSTTIAGAAYSCSGQAGFLVSGDNVSISGVTITSEVKDALKVTKIADTAGLGLVENFSLTNSKVENREVKNGEAENPNCGNGLNLHGVQNAVITNVTATSGGKCAISIANSPAGEGVHGVTLSGCTLSGVWGAIGLMYGSGNAYEQPVDLVLDKGNKIADSSASIIYSERSSTAEGTDSITFNGELEGLTGIVCGSSMKISAAEGVQLPTTNLAAEVNGVSYTTVQAAVDAASTGATVKVYAGKHDGSIVIDRKNITLEGSEEGTATITISADTASKIVSQDAIAGETIPYSGIVAVKDATVTLKNLTIKGNPEAVSSVKALTHDSRYAGLAALDSNVTLDNCDIQDITFKNDLKGMQNGFGIYAVSSTKHTLNLVNVDISNFNKAGAVIRSNVDLEMTGGSVKGFGNQAVISQNGIQYAGNAEISGTIFSGLQYSADDQWKGGSVAIYNVGFDTESTIEKVTTTGVDYSISTSAPTEIKSGTYDGNVYGGEGETVVLTISGGTFEQPVDESYLPEGYEQNGSGTVLPDTPVSGGGTTEEPEQSALPFTDVKTGDWFYQHVLYVYENNIMAGMSETTFEPLTTLNRAMAVQILYNLEGQPSVGNTSFTEVEGWYKNAITWAEENDIVAGYGDGTFGPEDPVTREQFAIMMYKYAKLKGEDVSAQADLSKFSDADSISGWALTAMQWANAAGIINGNDDNTLAPGGTATRAQAAAILSNYSQK